MNAPPVRVDWSHDFLLIDCSLPVREALQRVRHAPPRWVVLQRHGGLFLYAFRPEELLQWAPLAKVEREGDAGLDRPLDAVLGLHEEHQSTQTAVATLVAPIDRSWRREARAPSIARYVAVDALHVPMAVGVAPVPTAKDAFGDAIGGDIAFGSRAPRSSAPPLPAAAPPGDTVRGVNNPPMRGTTGVVPRPALGPPPTPTTSPRTVRGAAPAPAVGAPAPDVPARRGARAMPGADATPAAAAPSEPGAIEASAASTETAREDEGTTPLRHPSIEADRALLPGADVVVTVDLLRQADPETQGRIDIGTLDAAWSALDLDVRLQSAALAFDEAVGGTVTIRRNAASVPARIAARVRDDAPSGPVVITASFFAGTRYCGTAVRVFALGTVAAAAVPATASTVLGTSASPQALGLVAVEPDAPRPDVTVHISTIDKAKPGRLRWLVVTERFDGLAPCLEDEIDLGQAPADEARALFETFAVLERGAHTGPIEGFGTRLWNTAPPMFRGVYWALWDRHRRPLTIQFISDEPHLPWELMRPVRDDESEIHPPLALKHAVARWIKRWDGYMRSRLPAGRLYTIAPKYKSASRALQRAQKESEMLVASFAAQRADGTRRSVLSLLETAPPAEPVAFLHFAGHGQFAPKAATASSIKLEDGDLAVADVERPEVRLGRACRTVVFFNACEVASAGAVFAEVGGWADAFIGRQFGGYIAPLWSVDDEDAGVVAAELIDRVCRRHEPIGGALQAIRAAHGATSPTFYSYLYYGDVMARIGA